MIEENAIVGNIRTACQGTVPLRAKLQPWMVDAMENQQIHSWVDKWASPLNLINTNPFVANITSLRQIAEEREIDFQVFFARKANKCLAFVDTAKAIGAGVDTASLVELAQVLERGVDPHFVICTAAIKNEQLLEQCITNGVTIAIDNADEYVAIERLALELTRGTPVALRISGFMHDGDKLSSRFGIDIADAEDFTAKYWPVPGTHPVRLSGIHFHLDGYSAAQRVSAIQQSLTLIDSLRERGHPIEFLDIGGGFPMSYLESQQEWDDFWNEHERAMLQQRGEITYKNHSLGRQVQGDAAVGTANSYPYWQSLVQGDWLAKILDAEFEGDTIAAAIRSRNLQLRCEPGRSILDGCGMTVARVEFRKQHPDGYWLIGLSMNRTQCRTSSDDFLVDPLLIPSDLSCLERTEEIEGYFVGAYCTESELLSLRKMRFSEGVAIGDLVIFPNTAGYLMHFLESRSHQFPLAKNVSIQSESEFETVLTPDLIDQ